MLKLAGPVILGEIGWMSMGIVDTIMVSPLGPAAIGAIGMSSSVFITIAIFGIGLMLGLDALVSQAFGAGHEQECRRWLSHGALLAVALTPLIMLAAYAVFSTVGWWGLHPDTLALVRPYLRITILGTAPLLLYAVFRRYLQGVHYVRPIMVALVTANVVNAAGNWMLIHGHWGFPALGVSGAAWATNAARIYLAVVLGTAIVLRHRESQQRPDPFVFETSRLWQLLRLGIPAGSQVTLEVGVFATVSALAGRLAPIELAAHQVTMNIASMAFMIPLGLASAAAVRVGHAVGARDPLRSARAGWTAFATGAAIMTAVALVFVTMPGALIRLFTTDVRVITMGVQLLGIAALFQLFDGIQAVATGVLRGIGDTRTPMISNTIGHWCIGLPVGYTLCFNAGWGVQGLWVGLGIGLGLVALALTLVWARATRGDRLLPLQSSARESL